MFIRRALIILLPIVLVACASLEAIESQRTPLQGFSILQGHTDQETTQISVLVPKGKTISYSVKSDTITDNISLREIYVQHFARKRSQWQIDKIKVMGLNPDQIYTLEVRDAYGELLDAREFTTLDTQRHSVRFAAAANFDLSRQSEQRNMWNSLLARKPQFIVLLGNFINTFANKPVVGNINPDIIWASHVQARLSLDLYRTPKLVPTYAVWSSADYGELNGGRRFKYKSDSAEIFKTFFPQENSDDGRFNSGPGSARFWSAFHMGFAFLDSHTFRDTNEKADYLDTPWGSAQEKWLIKRISESPVPVWIFNSESILCSFDKKGQHYVTKFSDDLKNVMSQLNKLANPSILLTAGNDFFQALKIERPQFPLNTFEIQVGPLHAQPSVAPWIAKPKNLLLDGWANKLNYAIFEASNNEGNLSAQMTVLTNNNEVLANRFLSIEKNSKKLKTY